MSIAISIQIIIATSTTAVFIGIMMAKTHPLRRSESKSCRRAHHRCLGSKFLEGIVICCASLNNHKSIIFQPDESYTYNAIRKMKLIIVIQN